MSWPSRLGCALCFAHAACATSPPPPQPPEPTTDQPERGPSALEGDPFGASPSAGASSSRGWLGVELARAGAAEAGVLVRRVIRGSPAERAGLAPGDRVLRLDGEVVAAPEDVIRIVSGRTPGSRTGVVVARGGQQRLIAVELGAAPNEDGVMRMTYVGARAPGLQSLVTVQGSVTPTLAGLAGQVVVVEFWAPWCAVCRFLVPKLNDWHARYGAQGVAVLGVTMEAVDPASRAARQLGMSYPIASDHSGKTTLAYRANALPTLFVLDRRGVVRDVLVGYSSARLAEIESLVERLLAEP